MSCCPADAPRLDSTRFLGLTARQLEACALRYYGDGAGPLSLGQIAERMGISRPAVLRLIRRGTAQIERNGYTVADLTAQASAD